MRSFTFMLLILATITLSASAGPEAEDNDRLRNVAAEVAARRLVREHESGKRKASEEQLLAARAVIRKGEERRAREIAPGPNGGFAIAFRDSDMDAVKTACGAIFGGEVTIGSRIRIRKISLSVAAQSIDEFRTKVRRELELLGIYFIYRPTGLILDLEPDSYRYPMEAK